MKRKIIIILIFTAILASSLHFGLSRIRDFSGVDEPYWSYDRVPKFWSSVSKKKWKSTNISDKPGVPLAIISGAGLPFLNTNPKDLRKLRYIPKTIDQTRQIRDVYFFLRLPVFLFTLAILPVFYFLIKRLLGTPTARFSLIFIALSPVLLGISLIINSDSILWITTGISTLSLFVFFKTEEKKYLILSGALLGLSVITKYVANILFIYFFVLFCLEYILYAHKKYSIEIYLKKAFLNYISLTASAMATAFIFFPATWVRSSVLWNATLGNDVFSSIWPLFVGFIALLGADAFFFKSFISKKMFAFLVKYRLILTRAAGVLFLAVSAFVFLHVYTSFNFFDIQGIIASPKGIGEAGNTPLVAYFGATVADLFSLLFSVSPLILALILTSGAYLFHQKSLERDLITVFYIILFIFIFYLGSAVNDVIATVRYQIMTYPLAFILAAIAAARISEIPKIKKLIAPTAFVIVSFLILLASLFSIKPHFLAYASEILPKNLIVNLKGMGEGSIEAASFLNAQPGAREMTIWSDKGAVCEAFVGKCFIDFKSKTFKENEISYFVVSTDRRSRSLKMSGGSIGDVDFEKLYNYSESEYEVIIGGRVVNFVKVIKNN